MTVNLYVQANLKKVWSQCDWLFHLKQINDVQNHHLHSPCLLGMADILW